MSAVFSSPWSVWLIQATAHPDTTVTKLVSDHRWWQVLIDIEQAIVPLLLIALLVAVVIGIAKVGQGVSEVGKMVKSSTSDVAEAARLVNAAAHGVRRITESLETEGKSLGSTVHEVNEGIQTALTAARDRLRRFDAMVGVAQDEVEDFVVATAANLRGLRAGGSVLRQTLSFVRRNGRHVRDRQRRRRAERSFAENGGTERHGRDSALRERTAEAPAPAGVGASSDRPATRSAESAGQERPRIRPRPT